MADVYDKLTVYATELHLFEFCYMFQVSRIEILWC